MKRVLYLFVVIIGSIMASLVMYAIPVLLTCSFAFNWPGSAKFFLSIAMFTQLVFTFGQICAWIDNEDVF